ncbi:MAG TPA: lysylphosphatidylglycerol synthase domain-containing protein [Bryobacteraceae bacterium]|nr:lysylphosphatidylglycerol synthase domain-containing protein [Bryobacteraceae bacterium]
MLAVSRFPTPSLPRLLFLALGFSLFCYLLIHLGPSQILQLLLSIGWGFLLVLAIYPFYEFSRAAALGKCIGGEGCSYADLIKIRLAGAAVEHLTFTGPFLAEPAKALLLRNRGLSAPRAFAATVAEYLAYSFSSAIMAVAGLLYIMEKFRLSPPVTLAARIIVGFAALYIAASAAAILGRIYLLGSILNSFAKLPFIGQRIRAGQTALRATEDGLFSILRVPRRLLSILALDFLAQAFLVLELFVLLRSASRPFSASAPFLIESATKFINLGFFFVPGQMGAAEGVYAVVFHAMGLAASVGFSVALARRLRNLLFSGAGLGFLTVLRRRSLRAG